MLTEIFDSSGVHGCVLSTQSSHSHWHTLRSFGADESRVYTNISHVKEFENVNLAGILKQEKRRSATSHCNLRMATYSWVSFITIPWFRASRIRGFVHYDTFMTEPCAAFLSLFWVLLPSPSSFWVVVLSPRGGCPRCLSHRRRRWA